MISNIIATSFTALSYTCIIFFMLMPDLRPRENVAITSAISITIIALPKKADTFRITSAPGKSRGSTVVAISNTTGSIALTRLLNSPGSLSSGMTAG